MGNIFFPSSVLLCFAILNESFNWETFFKLSNSRKFSCLLHVTTFQVLRRHSWLL